MTSIILRLQEWKLRQWINTNLFGSPAAASGLLVLGVSISSMSVFRSLAAIVVAYQVGVLR
jgi:hypothetical protein